MTDRDFGLAVFGLILAFIGIVWICDLYTKRHRPNKRRPDVLPEPSEHCRRSPDWRSQTLQGRFW